MASTNARYSMYLEPCDRNGTGEPMYVITDSHAYVSRLVARCPRVDDARRILQGLMAKDVCDEVEQNAANGMAS